MTVSELIEELQKYPGDWDVQVMDGSPAPSLQPVSHVFQPSKYWDWYPEEMVEIAS